MIKKSIKFIRGSEFALALVVLVILVSAGITTAKFFTEEPEQPSQAKEIVDWMLGKSEEYQMPKDKKPETGNDQATTGGNQAETSNTIQDPDISSPTTIQVSPPTQQTITPPVTCDKNLANIYKSLYDSAVGLENMRLEEEIRSIKSYYHSRGFVCSDFGVCIEAVAQAESQSQNNISNFYSQYLSNLAKANC